LRRTHRRAAFQIRIGALRDEEQLALFRDEQLHAAVTVTVDGKTRLLDLFT
jgi:hypothetical protein